MPSPYQPPAISTVTTTTTTSPFQLDADACRYKPKVAIVVFSNTGCLYEFSSSRYCSKTIACRQEQVELKVLRNEITRLINENAFVSKLDTQSITRRINRVADVKEDALESLYEKRCRKKSLATENIQHEIDTVDALHVKTLDGQVYYRTVSKGPNKLANAQNEDETVGENDDIARDNGIVKLAKAEKRAKLKKLRKEATKQGTPMTELEEVKQSSQAEVLTQEIQGLGYQVL
ncbi:hypothetical protein L2E82_20636 [Cichorium intybus]|uniref:Uncharacterized protein n=1 Tax=Cichorium intybus TaxID=13427 RepID=A0ACB9DUQ3_CICIN|nr:hypothetical protein L2E82_20636 [Cichorium intybus]